MLQDVQFWYDNKPSWWLQKISCLGYQLIRLEISWPIYSHSPFRLAYAVQRTVAYMPARPHSARSQAVSGRSQSVFWRATLARPQAAFYRSQRGNEPGSRDPLSFLPYFLKVLGIPLAKNISGMEMIEILQPNYFDSETEQLLRLVGFNKSVYTKDFFPVSLFWIKVIF